MVAAISSAEGRDRQAAEGGSLAQKRGLDSPERLEAVWAYPIAKTRQRILWAALPLVAEP